MKRALWTPTSTSPIILPRQDSRPGTVHLWLFLVACAALIPLVTPGTEASAPDISALAPLLSHPEGWYDHDILLKMDAGNPQARILYTLDGSIPTQENGTYYTQPVHLSAGTPAVTVLRARLALPDGELGPTVNASYWLGVQAELPIMSLIVDPSDLWGAERGICANPLNRGRAWERPVYVTYLDGEQVAFQVPAGLRIHGNSTRIIAKKSFRLYFRQEYGLTRLDYSLFEGLEGSVPGSWDSEKRLVLHDGGQDFAFPGYGANWSLIRTPLINDLASQLRVRTTSSRPILLFINGVPQGIYHVRHYIDEWFYSDKFGIDLTGETAADEHWEHFAEFIATQDVADQENYLYLQSQVDILNLIDYYLLQIYVANSDWLYTNVERFLPDSHGGRWQWILWDVDYGFGLAPWGDYDYNMMDYIFYADRPGLEEEARPLRRLLDNPDFRDQFLSRAADLLNTVFAPERVTARIDALAAELRPDIQYELALWSSPGDWEASVAYLREFAQERPDAMREHLIQHFNLPGTTELVFSPPAEGEGRIAVNGMLVPDGPWKGVYFQGSTVHVTAVPEPGYCFAGWLPADLPQTPVITHTVSEQTTFSARFQRNCGSQPHAGDVIITEVQVDDTDTIEGDWFRLVVSRPGGVDLRGWRITDNDTKTGTDEGSLILSDDDIFAHVPNGTVILIAATQTVANDRRFPRDDLSVWPFGQMVLYRGNDHLDADTDAWFDLAPNDNLVLLAPGPTSSLEDDQGIAFASTGVYNVGTVTPASFGILADGVTAGMPTIDP
jgi:hypothetical protein